MRFVVKDLIITIMPPGSDEMAVAKACGCTRCTGCTGNTKQTKGTPCTPGCPKFGEEGADDYA
jgi:hypothetical protein